MADRAAHGLGPDWVPGADGIPCRAAARVVVLDARDRVLLVRGHDAGAPERSWWVSVGGGIAAGETAREAAVRELFEETGVRADPADLAGPVLRRSSIFDFARVTCRQDEEFFLLRLDHADDAVGTAAREGWTELEADVLDELRWWAPDDLAAHAATGAEVFPIGLAAMLGEWLRGWDGVTRSVREGGA